MPFCMLGPGRKCGPVPDAADISAGYTFRPFFIHRLRVGFTNGDVVLPACVNAASFGAEGPAGQSCPLEQTRVNPEMRPRMLVMW